jgi:hypothetical protein
MNRLFAVLAIAATVVFTGLRAETEQSIQIFFDNPVVNPTQYSGYVESAARVADIITQCSSNITAKKITSGTKQVTAFLHQALLDAYDKNVETHVLVGRFGESLVNALAGDKNLFQAVLEFVFKEGVRRVVMNASRNDSTGVNPAIMRLLNAFMYYAVVDSVQRLFSARIFPVCWDNLSEAAVEEMLGHVIKNMRTMQEAPAEDNFFYKP